MLLGEIAELKMGCLRSNQGQQEILSFLLPDNAFKFCNPHLLKLRKGLTGTYESHHSSEPRF